MTIFGVTGSVALLFTGFGVQHSISEIKDRQFGSIIKYDMIVAENMDTNTDKLYKMLVRKYITMMPASKPEIKMIVAK